MTNPVLRPPSMASSTNVNMNSNAIVSMTGDVITAGTVTAPAVHHRNRDPSMSPATKAKARLPRAKSAVTFGEITAAASVEFSTSASTSTSVAAIPSISNRSKQRPFRSIIHNDSTSSNNRQWVTREIAALEFLQMGIPMAREGSIVHEGWNRQHQRQHDSNMFNQSKELFDKSFSGGGERKEEDDGIFPISPSLLSSERSTHNPALTRQGRWWEKWIVGQNAPGANQQQQQHPPKGVNVSRDSQIEDLEEPDEPQRQTPSQSQSQAQSPLSPQQQQQPTLHAPGRRLEGDAATKVQIPLANNNALHNYKNNHHQGDIGIGSTHQHHIQHQQRQRQNSDVVSLQLTKHQSIARMAISKEWELRVAHGLEPRHHPNDHPSQLQQQNQHRHHNPAMLDGRMYMSAKESYPMMVFSLLRYEPKKEEALRRRQKLEERGGGGTQFFIMPSRDWRGISFRALLPVTIHKDEDDSSKTNHRERRHDGIEEREETDSATEKRNRSTNNPRLLFDRFAAKMPGPKYNFADGEAKDDSGDISIYDGIPPDSSTKASSGDGDGRDKDLDLDDTSMNTDDEDEGEDEGMGDDTYVVGLLDDPGMVQGRHRNVMIGDRGTGPIVSSTIQFVKPKLLKADLNKQFRERFDGYEPPISQRKFIGAKVVDGMYTLMDPTQEKGVDGDEGSNSKKKEDDEDDVTEATTVGTSVTLGATTASTPRNRRRQGSTSSISLSTNGGGSIEGGTGEGTETIRMPPSLTLSKIRSLKQQALAAAVRAKLEISTVALAIIYFERLCLDCRVDKSNRRLSFAACLLLAIKINEPHVGVIATKSVTVPPSSKKSKATQRIQSLIRTSKKSSSMFASLLEFFTQEWNISLKHLFAAEWSVFAALQFRLKAKPSDVAFHFRRLMKTLGYDPRRYLGAQVYGTWQRALSEEEFQRQEREVRVEARRRRREKKKLKQLRREIEEAADRRGDDISVEGSVGDKNHDEDARVETGDTLDEQNELPSPNRNNVTRRRRGLGDIFKNRIIPGSSSTNSTTGGPPRSASTERPWTKRRGSGDASQASDRFYMRRRGSGDAAQASTKNNPPRQRPRPQMLRPLSQSQSMLSLSAKGRELMEKNNAFDELSDSKKGKVILDDLKEESDRATGRQRVGSSDEDEGIMI